MFLLRKPSPENIRAFLAAQARLDLTYGSVGATAAVPPHGYLINHTRVKLGEGKEVFFAARAALERWEQFQLGWVEAGPPETPIEEGQVVAVLARVAGVWWLNACRIVAVNEDENSFGFAYGTLPGHVGTGEERFLIEHDPEEDSVWYDILAFSRPYHFLARMGRPLMRLVQRRFGRDSAAAMQKAVRAALA